MSDVVASVLATVNAPLRVQRSAANLALALVDPASVDRFDAGVFAFYSEVAFTLQREFLAEMKVDVTLASAIAAQFSALAGYSLPLAKVA